MSLAKKEIIYMQNLYSETKCGSPRNVFCWSLKKKVLYYEREKLKSKTLGKKEWCFFVWLKVVIMYRYSVGDLVH